MLKRKHTGTVEHLRESSITAQKGIDATKSPETQNCAQNLINLESDYDGALKLRNPLLLNAHRRVDKSDFLGVEPQHILTNALYNGSVINIDKYLVTKGDNLVDERNKFPWDIDSSTYTVTLDIRLDAGTYYVTTDLGYKKKVIENSVDIILQDSSGNAILHCNDGSVNASNTTAEFTVTEEQASKITKIYVFVNIDNAPVFAYSKFYRLIVSKSSTSKDFGFTDNLYSVYISDGDSMTYVDRLVDVDDSGDSVYYRNTLTTGVFCEPFDFSECKLVNTSAESVLFGFKINGSYRCLKIKDKWLYIVTPDVNVASLNDLGNYSYNLALDNPYSMRDVYYENGGYGEVTGIVMYANSDKTSFAGVAPVCDYRRSPVESIKVSSYKDSDGTYLYSAVALSDLEQANLIKWDAYKGNPMHSDSNDDIFVTFLHESTSSNGTVTGTVKIKVRLEYAPCLLKYQIGNTVYNTVMFPPQYNDLKDVEDVSTVKYMSHSFTINVPLHLSIYVIAQAFCFRNIHTVKGATEGTSSQRYRPFSILPKSYDAPILLKAFARFPHSIDYACIWEASSDGISFEPADVFYRTLIDYYTLISKAMPAETKVLVPVSLHDKDVLNETISASSEEGSVYACAINAPASSYTAYSNYCQSEDEYIFNASTYLLNRPDCLQICSVHTKMTFRFSMYRIESVADSTEYKYKATALLGRKTISLAQLTSNYEVSSAYPMEFAENDLGSPMAGDALYYKGSFYSFGQPVFKDNVFVSEAGSYSNYPITNVIDLSYSESSCVNALVPWRDYLIAASDTAIYLVTKVDGGYTTKIVTTSVGIPENDKHTCCAIMNGIVFKSHKHIYTLQPSLYSTDNILHLSEISIPVQHCLKDLPSFAFMTSDAYILFMTDASENCTWCVKYVLSTKTWSQCRFDNVQIVDFKMLNVDDVRLFTSEGDEMYFDKTCTELSSEKSADRLHQLSCKDLTIPVKDYNADTEITYNPIAFEFDTGNRSDNMSWMKQFVETKITFVTKSDADAIPLTVEIFVDGNPIPINKMDVASDSAFWRDSVADKGVLNTTIYSADSDISGTVRTLFLRHSCKGRTIRYRITGNAVCDFKLYEIAYRYKYLNVKQ